MPIRKDMPHAKPQNTKKKKKLLHPLPEPPKGYQLGGILRGVRDRFGGGSNVSDDFINRLLEGGVQSPEALQALRRRGLGNRAAVPGRFGRPTLLPPAEKARKARAATKVASYGGKAASHGGLVSRGYGVARSPKGKKYV